MPLNNDLKKVLVIGSGPIIIGQAAEFDYSGTQACQALKEEGIEVILVNSNPATIMTDTHIADKVYMEPLTLDFLVKIIRIERPDGILATLGGQTGLNLAVELAKSGILKEEGVQLLGTDLNAITKAEDRELFRQLMFDINEPVPESDIIHSLEEALAFAERIGYPIIVRPAYTLGGTGGGIGYDEESLTEIVQNGLKLSPINQCLVEASLLGFVEMEIEIVRDGNDQCVIVCDLENIDPVGVHTGDSIVVAPSQTLTEEQLEMFRTSAKKIIRALGVQGGCNVQYALDPKSNKYFVIEVNPRVSRSSALASKATGYPIAKISSKIAIGYHLDEILNPMNGEVFGGFEPKPNYTVIKIPRWPFDKFLTANRKLGTQMKATGEVMAIGKSIPEALLKAVRSLELGTDHLYLRELVEVSEEELFERLDRIDDERLFILAELMRREVTVQELHTRTDIHPYFLEHIAAIVIMEQEIEQGLTDARLKQAKELGVTDRTIARLSGVNEREISQKRTALNVKPVYKMVDTDPDHNMSQIEMPYYYSTYEGENEWVDTDKERVVVLGSGPIRIGQGVEFDYSTVHAVWAIQEAGYEAVIINNNPETVSTDFTTADRLYFEPLYIEDVLHILEQEQPIGVVVQFGGQTALNLAKGIEEAGYKILGTTLDNIDRAEDRKRFEAFMEELNLRRPPGKTVTSVETAVDVAKELGYPVLVRPSYVLGGRAMEIVYTEGELLAYMKQAVQVNPDHPVLIDRYLLGKELELDAISDGEEVLIPGIMEHIERAGVHSGDSIAVYPPHNLSQEIKDEIITITTQIARGLQIKGLLNIQYVLFEGRVYVLEVNPRSSRTVPFLSKVTGIPMANLATKILLGSTLQSLGYRGGYHPEADTVSVKVPVFSFAKLRRVDITLGPEMKSTGEVIGRDRNIAKALYKGLVASGMKVPTSGTILATISDKDKEELLPMIKRFRDLGFGIVATKGTAEFLKGEGIIAQVVNKINEASPTVLDVIQGGEVDIVVNTLTRGKTPARDGFRIRRESVENGIPCLTSIDTLAALLKVLETITFRIEEMPTMNLDQGKESEELLRG